MNKSIVSLTIVALFSSGSLFSQSQTIDGDLIIPNSTGPKSIYTWGSGDTNWRIGMGTSPGFTRSLTSDHVNFVTYSNGGTQGFALGVNGGNSSFEIKGADHTAFFRGNVGIGTAAPSAKLEVHGTTAIGQYTNGTAVIDAFNSYAYFGCNIATNGLAIGPTGYAGLGTSSPSTLLHLNSGVPSGVQALNNLTKLAVDAASGGFAEFRNTSDNNTYSGLLFTDNNLGGYVTFRNYPDDKLHIGGYGGIAFEVGSDNNVGGKTERLRIDANGNVGIGTSTPVTALEVAGDFTASSRMRFGTANAYGGSYGVIGLASGVAGKNIVFYNYDGPVNELMTLNGTTGTAAINNGGLIVSGNVGIGTTTPDQKLTVNGTIHAKEIKVDLSVPGPDYVFEKDYKLTSIEDIKTYVDQNKHLPEVPSAKEMEKNGINLSEMNMLLLKKVEELTLYVIALKVGNEEVKRKNLEAQEQMKKMQIEIDQLKK